MSQPFLSDNTYRFLFSLAGLVYIAGLFVPLMDNDSAHHANIALHMHLTGDYVSLIDHGKDYLDKPHLHFWLAAFSYKILGVTSFAYKFPSFLFTILGSYSTYRLGRALYNKEVGKLSALIVTTSFAYILANNDVRMDAILTASIIFASWQLVEFIQTKKTKWIAGAALGLALGFATKGHIAVFTPIVGAFFYILNRKTWKDYFNWKWLLLILFFFAFISPVLYAYYIQYDQHPEKIIRGRSNISGLEFILWGQSVERFEGDSFGSDASNDYFFFFHSFLWAFAPWSVLAFITVISRIRNIFKENYECFTLGTFVTLLIIITFSGFKLPHYLNIIFPATSVMTSSWILDRKNNENQQKKIFIIQLICAILILLLAAAINSWVFPVNQWWVIVGTILFLSLFFYYLRSDYYSKVQKAILISVSSIMCVFFLLNTNFYQRLLKYQGGNILAKEIRDVIDPNDLYFYPGMYSSSLNFYTSTLRKEFTHSVLQQKKTIWLVIPPQSIAELQQQGYEFGRIYRADDFEITRLNLKFINPATRPKELTGMVIAETSLKNVE